MNGMRRRKHSSGILAGKKYPQLANSDPLAKVALRQRVLDHVLKNGGKGTVLNVLPGLEDMMGREWRKLGADVTALEHDYKFFRDRGLNIYLDGGPYDIYDVDTYSNPFPFFDGILKAREDRNFVLIGTDAGITHVKINVANERGYKAGLRGPEKLPENYERWLLKRGQEMVKGPVRMLAIWKKPGKTVLYFTWLLGRYAARELANRE
jgi:hypothetical protein